MPFPKNKDFNRLIIKAQFQKDENLPFVLYQKPNEKIVKAIFPTNMHLIYAEDFRESGFVFAPFDNAKKAILLSSDNTNEVSYEANTSKKTTGRQNVFESGKELHLQLISKAIDTINKGGINKVVVSRKLAIESEKDEFELFEKLLNAYPNTFKYLWYHPKVGMWLGATPETLLKVNEAVLTTTSLAGTVPIIDSKEPNWSSKEIEEQKMVTDYILETLSNMLSDVEITNPSSIKAGKVWHLKSVISGLIKENISLGKIVNALHPTPAVCGVPKNIAYDFILKNEKYDREFYTGFLGELNMGTGRDTYLSVNLRCMKIESNSVCLFVGGGITKQSIPEKEWKETQHKSRTMLNLL